MASAMKHLLEQTMFGSVLPDGHVQLTLSMDDVNYLIDMLDVNVNLSVEDDLYNLSDTSRRIRDEIKLQAFH